MTEPLPQRFRYKLGDAFVYGTCFSSRNSWLVYCLEIDDPIEANGDPKQVLSSVVGPLREFEWIDTDHDWPGDRMPDETCVWNEMSPTLIEIGCCDRVSDVGYNFCLKCGKRIEVK